MFSIETLHVWIKNPHYNYDLDDHSDYPAFLNSEVDDRHLCKYNREFITIYP